MLLIEKLYEVFKDVHDQAGNLYGSIELRLLLTNYPAEILSLWTKEFGSHTTAMVLLYVMQDQYKQALSLGSMQPSKGYTVRALSTKSGISKSTIQRKLKDLEKLGILRLQAGNISIAYDEDGASSLQRKLPHGKTIVDNHIRQMLKACGMQRNKSAEFDNEALPTV